MLVDSIKYMIHMFHVFEKNIINFIWHVFIILFYCIYQFYNLDKPHLYFIFI
jgi:hypothetical protein